MTGLFLIIWFDCIGIDWILSFTYSKSYSMFNLIDSGQNQRKCVGYTNTHILTLSINLPHVTLKQPPSHLPILEEARIWGQEKCQAHCIVDLLDAGNSFIGIDFFILVNFSKFFFLLLSPVKLLLWTSSCKADQTVYLTLTLNCVENDTFLTISLRLTKSLTEALTVARKSWQKTFTTSPHTC